MEILKSKRFSNVLCAAAALVHTVITFITDRGIFTFPAPESSGYSMAIADYTICKIAAFAVLFAFYTGIARLITVAVCKKKGTHAPESASRFCETVKCALPYFVVIAVVLAIKLPGGYISNDENSIYANAVTLTHDTWFYYITTYYYIISLMLIPFKYGPIIMKVIIQFLTVGYVVFRIRSYYGKKLGLWGYLLFLLYPVIAYTTSAHRLPVYFLIYLVVFAKLLFDKLENHELGKFEGFMILFAGAVLTQWRTEGIYLAVIIPVIMLLAYPNIRNRKSVLILIVTTLVLQYAVSIMQNGFSATGLGDAANDRMKPFYAYTITNMYRNGLNLEANAEDLAIVDRYLSLEAIRAINEHYEDINYEDVLILYQEGFVGVRPEATVEDFIAYSDALKRIFINNPDVFIRTRIGAFKYAALPFKVVWNGFGIGSLISFGISIVKSISYNLFIPLCVVVLLCLYSLIRRRWYSFFVFGGLIAHWFIVFILAPASYFKYYFPMYIMAYFYVAVIILWLFGRRKEPELGSPVC